MNLAVIMSLYRGESPRNFKLAVASLLNQQFSTQTSVRIYLGIDGPITTELEMAVVDLSGVFHKVIRFEQNRGLAPVLNDLISALEDEPFIFRMDTDDYSHPLRFERQLRFFSENLGVEVVGTSIVEVDESSGIRRVVHFADGWGDALKSLSRRVPVAHPTVCFRASVFQKVGGYPTVRNNEDIALWFECVKQGIRISNIREPLYEFRINKNFWARRSYQKAFSEFRVYINGLRDLKAAPVAYLFPVLRLMLRLSPARVQQVAYGSGFRNVEAWDDQAATNIAL